MNTRINVKSGLRSLGSALALLLLSPAVSQSQTLWYNGDLPSGGGGTVNEIATSPNATFQTYDDFVVNDPAGWTVTGVFSNDSMNRTGITQALWEIRTGVSVGNGGTVVASGTSAATQTPTGRTNLALGFPEYTVLVSGLSVVLAPGTYWLSVAPLVGTDPTVTNGGIFLSYNSSTLGTNAVNPPPSPVGNGLFNGPSLGFNFASLSNGYSMGVLGVAGRSAVPEPGAFALLGGMLIPGLLVLRRRRG